MGILRLLDNCYSEQLNEAASSLTNSEILDKYCDILSNYIFPQLAQYTDFPGISSPVTWGEKEDNKLIVLNIDGISGTLLRCRNTERIYKVNPSVFSPSSSEFRLKVWIGTWKNHSPNLDSSELGLHFRFYLSNGNYQPGESQKFFENYPTAIMKKLSDNFADMFSNDPLIFTEMMKEILPNYSFKIGHIWGMRDPMNYDYSILPPYETIYKGNKLINIAECIIGHFEDNTNGKFAAGLFKDESTNDVYICFNPVINLNWEMNYRGKRDNVAQNALKSIFDEVTNLWKTMYTRGENIVNIFIENTTVSLDDFND